MFDKTDSDYGLFENYDIDETSSKEDLQQDLKEHPSENLLQDSEDHLAQDSPEYLAQDLEEDLQQNLEQGQNQYLAEDLPEDLQQGLSEEFIRELEKDIQQTPQQDLTGDLPKELSKELPKNPENDVSEKLPEDLVTEDVSDVLSKHLEHNKLNNSFRHYTKYSSKKTRSRFFNWSIGLAKLFLFMMLMPIILLIISMLGGIILSLLITGIGLIGPSLVALIGAAFYFASLTKTIVLLLIALSVTFFSFGLIIFLLGVLCIKKLLIFIKNYYKSKREKKLLAKEANAL